MGLIYYTNLNIFNKKRCLFSISSDKYILEFGQIRLSIRTNTFSGFHSRISFERSADQCDQTLCWSTAAWLHRQMLVIFCSLDLGYFVSIFLWKLQQFTLRVQFVKLFLNWLECNKQFPFISFSTKAVKIYD